MATERTLDSNGIPQPFNQAERDAANAEYIAADPKGKRAVLAKYPFLAGKDWKKYQPAPAQPTSTETK